MKQYSKPAKRSENSSPRRINAIGSAQLPRTIPDGAVASRMIVTESGGLDAQLSIGFFGSLSVGISEYLENLAGTGPISPYIPGVSIKFNLVNDINSFNLTLGFDELAFGSKAVWVNTVMSNGPAPGLPFTIQGAYISTGWSFSLLGEADMWGLGLRFPVLPVDAFGLMNTSLYGAVAVGISRYVVIGAALENLYIGRPMTDLAATLQLSFIPINDIDITVGFQWLPFRGPVINRMLSFGYEYAF